MSAGYKVPLVDLSAYAKKADVPVVATGVPLPEVTGGSAGDDMTKVSGWRHEHPRLTSAEVKTLGADGLLSLDFTRVFDAEPCPILQPIGDPKPTIAVLSWRMGTGPTAGKYVGANVQGIKPAPAPLASTTVLSISVLSGNQSVAPTYVPAANQKFSAVFLQQSTPAT